VDSWLALLSASLATLAVGPLPSVPLLRALCLPAVGRAKAGASVADPIRLRPASADGSAQSADDAGVELAGWARRRVEDEDDDDDEDDEDAGVWN